MTRFWLFLTTSCLVPTITSAAACPPAGERLSATPIRQLVVMGWVYKGCQKGCRPCDDDKKPLENKGFLERVTVLIIPWFWVRIPALPISITPIAPPVSAVLLVPSQPARSRRGRSVVG